MKKQLILLMFIVACAGLASAQPDRLRGRQWKLVQVEGVNVPGNSRAYLEIQQSGSRFSGHTGCNSMFGSVNVHARRVDFVNVGSTRMACLEPRVRRVETAFVNALRNADRYLVRAGKLELYTRNRVTATFAAPLSNPQVLPQKATLETMKWSLDTIRERPVPKTGHSAFVVFDRTKASVGGDSSCNVFGGNYSTTGATLKITDVISTMRACVEDERMSIERDFLDGLRQANRYELEGNKLHLYRNARLLLGFIGERK